MESEYVFEMDKGLVESEGDNNNDSSGEDTDSSQEDIDNSKRKLENKKYEKLEIKELKGLK
jgi:hypothetical protein